MLKKFRAPCCPGGVFLLFAAFVSLPNRNYVEGGICDDDKPCLGRGGCYVVKRKLDQTFASSKCVCTKGYTGRWCQFKEDFSSVQSAEDSVTVKGLPGMPRNLLALRKDSSLYYFVLVSWETPSESLEFPFLYFSIRYKETGKKWIYTGELLIDEDKLGYSYKFYTLELDTTYVVEVYAGNILGLGKPARTVIRLPRMISYPEIVEVSEDKFGTKLNEEVKLVCIVRGNPSPKITWLFNGDPMHIYPNETSLVNGTLTIFKTTFDHEGEYRCSAANIWGTSVSRPIEVTLLKRAVFYGPQDKLVIKADIGKPLTIRCPDHKETYPKPKYSWYYHDPLNDADDGYIIDSERVWKDDNGTLRFNNLTFYDVFLVRFNFGINCVLTQNFFGHIVKTWSRVINVEEDSQRSRGGSRLHDGPYFIEEPKDKIVAYRGESVRVRCAIWSDHNGNTLKRWRWNDWFWEFRKYLNKDKNTEIHAFATPKVTVSDFGRTFELHELESSDSGTIRCEFQDAKILSKTTLLTVKDETRPSRPSPKLIAYPPKQLTVYSGCDVVLFCAGQSMAKRTSLKWYWNGHLLPTNDSTSSFSYESSEQEEGKLKMQFVQRNYTGVYQCEVSFDNETLIATGYVYVQELEEHRKLKNGRSTSLTVPAGGVETFNCIHPSLKVNADHVVWKPEEKWRGQKLLSSLSLTVSNIHKSDTGSFSCQAKSDNQFSVLRRFELNLVDKVNGGWSIWSSWSSCRLGSNERCGNRSRDRARTCTEPLPSLNGYYCSGKMKEIQNCPLVSCPREDESVWSHWAPWSECSASCAPAVMSRRRMCLKPVIGNGGRCHGATSETQSCELRRCLFVPAEWFQWSAWSGCSKTCGMFITKTRQRKCSRPDSNGKPCSGKTTEKKYCKSLHCPNHVLKSSEEEVVDEASISKAHLWTPIVSIASVVVASLIIGLVIKVYREKFLKTKHRRLIEDIFYFNQKPAHGKRRQKGPNSKKRVPSKKSQAIHQFPSPKLKAQSSTFGKPACKMTTSSSGFSSVNSGVPTPPPPPPPPPPKKSY